MTIMMMTADDGPWPETAVIGSPKLTTGFGSWGEKRACGAVLGRVLVEQSAKDRSPAIGAAPRGSLPSADHSPVSIKRPGHNFPSDEEGVRHLRLFSTSLSPLSLLLRSTDPVSTLDHAGEKEAMMIWILWAQQ